MTGLADKKASAAALVKIKNLEQELAEANERAGRYKALHGELQRRYGALLEVGMEEAEAVVTRGVATRLVIPMLNLLQYEGGKAYIDFPALRLYFHPTDQ